MKMRARPIRVAPLAFKRDFWYDVMISKELALYPVVIHHKVFDEPIAIVNWYDRVLV
jgi:hypothetical protein